MSKIVEIVGMDNRGKHAKVHVVLDDGTEGIVWVGGEVEVFFDPAHDKIKCFVKKRTQFKGGQL